MDKIKHFMLPEHTNKLYHEEAISSIALTREVADKFNEIIDYINEFDKTDLLWKHEQEGRIRKGVLFMKDNLINSIHDLFNLLYESGELNEIITEATLDKLSLIVDKINGIVNVKSFGAVGDGVTNDYKALQDAIEYAEENSGWLYIPSGTYRYTGTLNIKKSIRIVGDKGSIQYSGTYLWHDDKEDIPAIYVGDSDYVYNVHFENIAVKNNAHDFLKEIPTTKVGLKLGNVSESRFVNCSFYGFNVGILMQGVTITEFDKCQIYYNNIGIWTAKKFSDLTFKTQNRFVKFHAMNIYKNNIGVMLGGEQLTFENCHFENQNESTMIYDNKYSADCKFLDISNCNVVSEFLGIPFMKITPSLNETSKILYTSIKNTQFQLSDADYCIHKVKISSNESYIISLDNIICMGVNKNFIGGESTSTITINQKGDVRCVSKFDGSGLVKNICENPIRLLGVSFDALGRNKFNGVLNVSDNANVVEFTCGDLWRGNDLLRYNDGKTNTYIHTHKYSTNENFPESVFEGEMLYDSTFNIPRFYNHRNDHWCDAIPKSSSVPKTGKWIKGDIVINSNPLGNGNVGWICVESGTPGKWRTFGTVSSS